MRLYILPLLLLLSVPVFGEGDTLSSIEGYPKWLLSENDTAHQTSGIAYLGNDSQNRKHFFLVDDIGFMHRMIISDDTLITLNKIAFSSEVKNLISRFTKKDFEEILYDRYTGRFYISVEGNKPLTKIVVGIYEIKLNKEPFTADSVLTIQKLTIKPEDIFLQYTDDNIGFEGITADKNYFYFALEGFSLNTLFSDSTLIYIVDKKDLTIKNVVSTKKQGIHTICGLYSDKDYSLYAIDRNQKLMFHLTIDKQLDIENCTKYVLTTHIPNYNSFDYVVSFESVTIDDKGGIYIVDDPWKIFYIPSEETLSKVDKNTAGNFRAFIPAIYKFKLK